MECSICKKPTIKCCSRCKTRYYCSPSCQKKDNANHVLDCPQRSADILAVLYEYGFSNFFSLHNKSMLLGLYIGLIVHLNCNASQIHLWWINGELPLNIKKTYDDVGVNSGYYQWFLKNEHMLQGLHKYEDEKSDKSITDSGTIPRIELEKEEEKWLGDLYKELIIQKGCKIDEFNDTYISGTILDLLKRKCNSSSSSWLSENRIEIHGYRQLRKSIYSLKQYVLNYGFMNCRTENERRQLKQMYKKLVKVPQFDPQDLHRACVMGKIFNYVSSILPNEVVKANLLRNLYPLKDLE
ncbi:hypothetical protein C1645_790922 [Glomus cerebriforme]|uniref:MYND-type domain-containing protein n=1 Tax=Glomus cerebriforme TaxID=658196 RepID=A0A397SA81_9GLOM|nr:hypothetical protein C1645_790922 [Glomus cerebriforme]